LILAGQLFEDQRRHRCQPSCLEEHWAAAQHRAWRIWPQISPFHRQLAPDAHRQFHDYRFTAASPVSSPYRHALAGVWMHRHRDHH
jgi:hypothetical protein